MPVSRFRVIIKYDKNLYHLADISINPHGGDVYYFPSERILVGRGTLVPAGRSVDHLSIHKDGRTHAKDEYGKKFQGPKILKIQDIGYQRLIVDDVSNFEGVGLPQVDEFVDGDCSLEMSDDSPPAAILQISIISGRMIVGGLARNHSVGENGLVAVNSRAIGYESGNADKLVQIALYYRDASPKDTGRRSFNLLKSTHIKRPEYVQSATQ